jgi:uncharacterized membrane protein
MTELLPDAPAEPAYAPPFWLSHHRFAERDRCFRLAGVHLCSRCLATYPVIFAALTLQLHRPMAPLAHPLDGWILFALPLPALLDWALGQLTGWKGNNALRFVSGALLGISLGRALYIHIRHPGTPLVYAYGLGLAGFAGIVWGLRQVLGSRRG